VSPAPPKTKEPWTAYLLLLVLDVSALEVEEEAMLLLCEG
jgi:hypothetical protein